MKTLLGAAGVVGIVVLALALAQNLSADASAVVVGVAVGIGASIPTTLFMLSLIRRHTENQREPPPRRYDVQRWDDDVIDAEWWRV